MSSIHALPQDTFRLLRASAVVVTPVSLVKELVDNSIDANATSVQVQVSKNTVDKVEVRDNGDGICWDDFSALGRRAHTSQLRTFQELSHVGGVSLGFRGEALAAVNSFSEVTILTRTAGEPVGHRIRLKRAEGDIEEQSKISIPVGCTVQISDLFEKFPVRKKVALNASQKSLADMKHLLQSYALARPHIRFSLKVLGDSKGTWTYSPTLSPSVGEAVLQIFGKDLSTQCTHVAMTEALLCPNDRLVEELTTSEVSRITLEATLPKEDADPSEVNRKGAFISVDGRPLASVRGTPKKIVTAFKAKMGSRASKGGADPNYTMPFIQLNIQCPPGAYDVNVTPAKDEVMFVDEARILKLVTQLFEKCYKPTEIDAASHQKPVHLLSPDDLQALETFAIEDDELDDFKKIPESSFPVVEPSNGVRLDGKSKPDREASLHSGRQSGAVEISSAWAVDMSASRGEEIDFDEELGLEKGPSVLDQLHAAAAQRQQRLQVEQEGQGEKEGHPLVPVSEKGLLIPSSPESSGSPGAQGGINPWTIALQASNRAQGKPGPDHGIYGSPNPGAVDDEVNEIQADGRRILSPQLRRNGSPGLDNALEGISEFTPPRMFMPPVMSPRIWTPPSSAERVNPRQRNANPPFKLPSSSHARGRQSLPGRPRPHQARNPGSTQYRPQAPAGDMNGASGVPYPAAFIHERDTPSPGFLAGASLEDPFLDRDTASKIGCPNVGADHSDYAPYLLSSPTRDPPAPDPIVRTLTRNTSDRGDSSLGDDPRRYFVKRRRSMSRARKEGRSTLRRVRSNVLPLESVPVDKEMHEVVLDMHVELGTLRECALAMAEDDVYISTGICDSGLHLSGLGGIRKKLHDVVGDWSMKVSGKRGEQLFDFGSHFMGESME